VLVDSLRCGKFAPRTGQQCAGAECPSIGCDCRRCREASRPEHHQDNSSAITHPHRRAVPAAHPASLASAVLPPFSTRGAARLTSAAFLRMQHCQQKSHISRWPEFHFFECHQVRIARVPWRREKRKSCRGQTNQSWTMHHPEIPCRITSGRSTASSSTTC
jgi:hypothetical protein